jgi:hypothetical protein
LYIYAVGAAAALSLDPTEFVGLLEARPELLEQATKMVREDSDLAVQRATAGLNRAASVLATRLDNAHELSVAEITQITDRLDRLSALSKSQELAAKASPESKAEDPLDLLWSSILDYRPPLNGYPPNIVSGFRWLFLRPHHPARQARKRDPDMPYDVWMDTFFPLIPVDPNDPKAKDMIDLGEVAGVDFYVDHMGRKHEGNKSG